MTPERFGELLRRPELLSGQNATEIEQLITAYPWCGPLRQLRYHKAVLDGDDKALAHWRKRAEPYLNKANLTVTELRIRATNPAIAKQHFGFTNEIVEPTVDTEVEIDYFVDEAILVSATCTNTVDWYLHRHGLIMEYGRPKPAPKEAFKSYNDWKNRRAKTAWSELLHLADEKPKADKTRKPKHKEAIPLPEVASETLADLLAAQGHTDKAIRMYQQLQLRYPTKKATFAARIEALQQQEA